MWARNFEVSLGIWLAISWLIFDYRGPASLIINDVICCLLIIYFALASYTKKYRKIHLLSFLVGIWLIFFHLFFNIPERAEQNHIVLGILLLMLSIIPSHAERPPNAWINFMQHHRNSKKH